jgi:hypothetical protein
MWKSALREPQDKKAEWGSRPFENLRIKRWKVENFFSIPIKYN